MKKNIIAVFSLIAIGLGALLLPGCSSPADTVSHNISTEADRFNVTRRIVAINLITDKYLFMVTGRCSLGNADPNGEISIVCKVAAGEAPTAYQKHFIKFATGSNITVTVEQIGSTAADDYHYEFFFRPENIVPTIVR